MAKDFSKKFYASASWKKVRINYGASKFWLCEKCSQPASIVHHKKHLNKNNINDAEITLGNENLQLLCLECHNSEHGRDIIRAGLIFNDRGDLIKK